MYIDKLKEKMRISLKKHLSDAIKKKQVNNIYRPFITRRKNESREAYIRRIIRASAAYQFVKVNFKEKAKYVAFNVPDSPIITEFGKFKLIVAEVVEGRWGTHYILIYPNLNTIKKQKEIFIRTDSGCHIGMVLGDITCDCHAQLKNAQKLCIKNGSGIIVHMPKHDGRGWGDYKLSNQKIMGELNVDTVTAARLFYGVEEEIDQRSYDEVAIILKALGLNNKQTFNLATNNPKKIEGFVKCGMKISHTHSIIGRGISKTARKNLASKSKKWNHNLHAKSSKDS